MLTVDLSLPFFSIPFSSVCPEVQAAPLRWYLYTGHGGGSRQLGATRGRRTVLVLVWGDSSSSKAGIFKEGTGRDDVWAALGTSEVKGRSGMDLSNACSTRAELVVVCLCWRLVHQRSLVQMEVVQTATVIAKPRTVKIHCEDMVSWLTKINVYNWTAWEWCLCCLESGYKVSLFTVRTAGSGPVLLTCFIQRLCLNADALNVKAELSVNSTYWFCLNHHQLTMQHMSFPWFFVSYWLDNA